MAYEFQGEPALDYFPCRYGTSKLLFRGPRRRLDGDYAVVLGGTESYGKFIPDPYPALLEQGIGLPVVNFGYLNAGADVFLSEPAIIDACSRAKVAVVQLVGAPNMTNRFYAVHPRRNDRFLRASSLMKTIFSDVDFSGFHFTGHMLATLRNCSAEKYELVEQELKAAWTARMRQLLQKIGTKTVLLHIAAADDQDGCEPALVDSAMIAAIRGFAADYVMVRPSAAARAAGTAGMRFGELEAPLAATVPGPLVHVEIAAHLAPVLKRLL